MNKVYKYRANIALSDNGKKRDISQLHNNLFYAATFRELNDPFEGSVAVSYTHLVRRREFLSDFTCHL